MYFAAVMALSIRVDNQSLVDIFWGPGFVLVAVVSFVASRHAGGDEARRLVVLALTAIWGLRLGLHIGVRNIGHGQDPRYTAIMSHRSGSLAGYVARKIYGASQVTADARVMAQLQRLQEQGYGHFPVCIAKTPYSFSTAMSRSLLNRDR